MIGDSAQGIAQQHCSGNDRVAREMPFGGGMSRRKTATKKSTSECCGKRRPRENRRVNANAKFPDKSDHEH